MTTTDIDAYVSLVASALVDALGSHWGDSAATWVDEDSGVRWTVAVRPDHDTSINDFDCYGVVSDYVPYRDARRPRPPGFTGASRKIDADRGGFVWWEPYREGHKVYDSPGDVRIVADLVECGFLTVSVTHETQCAHCDEYRRTGYEALSGIDSGKHEVIKEIIEELAHQILFNLQQGAS